MAKELKLRMYTTNKMFDLEKLINKDVKLFEELCSKYPLKKECVYMVKYDTEPSPAPVIQTEAEPVEETKSLSQVMDETIKVLEERKAAESIKDDVTTLSETEAISSPVNEATTDHTIYEEIVYPEDFQPLYKVGEKVVLKIANDTVTEHITIQKITPKVDGGKIIGYYYSYLVEETGEVKKMDEEWLTDHEVIEGNE